MSHNAIIAIPNLYYNVIMRPKKGMYVPQEKSVYAQLEKAKVQSLTMSNSVLGARF